MSTVKILFAPGLKPVVVKHAEHDQSSHGNWAGTKGGSVGLDAMPFNWNPRKANYGTELSAEEYKKTLDLYTEIAKAPIAIRVRPSDLELIIADGRFKSLGEITSDDRRSEIYIQGRSEMENGLWGVPKTKTQPIYGYLDTNADGHAPATLVYGDVKITLKDNVAGRATFSAGDSLNFKLTPVLVKDAREGKVSNLDLIGSFRSYYEYPNDNYPALSQTRTENFQGATKYPYFETQIHGGISLKDIKSVDIREETGYTPPVSQKVIKFFRNNGIEVIETND